MIYAWILIVSAAAYLLGSIPFGLLLMKAAGKGDVRKKGSGNIGATNVLRTGSKALGIATLLLDAAKGYAAVWLAHYIYGGYFALLAGLAVVLGHIFPVWLRFRGGKGVATALGVFFALNPLLGLIVCLIWLAAFAFLRTASIASMMAVGYSAIAAYLLSGEMAGLLALALAILVIFSHRHNIKRLLDGTEHSFRKENHEHA